MAKKKYTKMVGGCDECPNLRPDKLAPTTIFRCGACPDNPER